MNLVKCYKYFVILLLCFAFSTESVFALNAVITVPAEDPDGVTLKLNKGSYLVKIKGGAMSLFYPINPNYSWIIGVAIGSDVDGGQDYANIGTLYYEPATPVYSQAETERQAVEAAKDNVNGTFLEFYLEEDKEVRFWVSDFDYSDNSGMVKLQIRSI